jgi:hypothetical protein
MERERADRAAWAATLTAAQTIAQTMADVCPPSTERVNKVSLVVQACLSALSKGEMSAVVDATVDGRTYR